MTKIEIKDSSELKNSDFDLFVLRVHVLSSLENAEVLSEKIKRGVYPSFIEPCGEKRTLVTRWCQRMSKTFKLLNLPYSMHNLRHSHESNMLMNNFPLIQLSHRLGHADPSITLSIYPHMIQELQFNVNEYMPSIELKQVK